MPFWHRIVIAAVVFVVPNEKPASDTIRNATIRSRETFAEVTVQVPLTVDLASVLVSAPDANATLTIRAAAPDEDAASRLEGDLRARARGRLRAPGVWG